MNFETDYYKQRLLIHKLETRIHKARIAYRVMRRTFSMTIHELGAIRKEVDDTRHLVAATKIQLERNIKQLEPIYLENKRLKDELAFYKAKEQM